MNGGSTGPCGDAAVQSPTNGQTKRFADGLKLRVCRLARASLVSLAGAHLVERLFERVPYARQPAVLTRLDVLDQTFVRQHSGCSGHHRHRDRILPERGIIGARASWTPGDIPQSGMTASGRIATLSASYCTVQTVMRLCASFREHTSVRLTCTDDRRQMCLALCSDSLQFRLCGGR